MLTLPPQDCVQLNQYKLQSEIGKVGVGRLRAPGASGSSAWRCSFSCVGGNGRQSQASPSLEVRTVSCPGGSSQVLGRGEGGWKVTLDS